LFPHADVIGLELYFPALRCLFNLFPHADVYWLWLIFSCLDMFYSICFLKQMLLPFALCFLHWDVYFNCSSCRWRSCAPWIMFFLHCDVYLICFFMQMLLALNYILLPWDLYSICFLVQMYIGLALGFLPYLFIYFVSSCSS
jgi:hypothetical protein